MNRRFYCFRKHNINISNSVIIEPPLTPYPSSFPFPKFSFQVCVFFHSNFHTKSENASSISVQFVVSGSSNPQKKKKLCPQPPWDLLWWNVLCLLWLQTLPKRRRFTNQVRPITLCIPIAFANSDFSKKNVLGVGLQKFESLCKRECVFIFKLRAGLVWKSIFCFLFSKVCIRNSEKKYKKKVLLKTDTSFKVVTAKVNKFIMQDDLWLNDNISLH